MLAQWGTGSGTRPGFVTVYDLGWSQKMWVETRGSGERKMGHWKKKSQSTKFYLGLVVSFGILQVLFSPPHVYNQEVKDKEAGWGWSWPWSELLTVVRDIGPGIIQPHAQLLLKPRALDKRVVPRRKDTDTSDIYWPWDLLTHPWSFVILDFMYWMKCILS